MSSLSKTFARVYNSLKRYMASAPCASLAPAPPPPEAKKSPKKKFAPCASSEPHRCKQVWAARLELPYYKSFPKIKTPAFKSREDNSPKSVLKIAPNPIPVGVGLTRRDIMDPKLAKLLHEYGKQKEANAVAMKTQMLSGKEPTTKIPEIKVREKGSEAREEEEEGAKGGRGGRPKGPLLRAV